MGPEMAKQTSFLGNSGSEGSGNIEFILAFNRQK